jgi:hypothetical protein
VADIDLEEDTVPEAGTVVVDTGLAAADTAAVGIVVFEDIAAVEGIAVVDTAVVDIVADPAAAVAAADIDSNPERSRELLSKRQPKFLPGK